MKTNVSELLARQEIRLMMLFVIGFGLATILKGRCEGALCRKYIAPDMKEIERGEWRHGVICHKVRLDPEPCPENGLPIISTIVN